MKTSWLSKCLENILLDILLAKIEPFIDPGQCGGLRKTSVNHYIIKLLDFANRTLDKNTPHAAVLCTEDLSKAYNRGSHNLVIEDLHAMHVPGYILAITCSYLEGRSLVLNYQGAKYEEKQLPGGFGAGTCLGGALFIVKFNGACLRPPIPRPMTQNRGLQVKYIDDASQIASINLKKSLIPDPTIRIRPLNYHERTEMVLNPQEDIMQQELNLFYEFTQNNKLLINNKKCFAMQFSKPKKYDFPAEFTIGGSEILEVKKVLRILGVIVEDTLQCNSQCKEMVRKATISIWAIRRMKALGVQQSLLVDYWKSEGRVHLEYGCLVWHSRLTTAQSRSLDRAQRIAMAAITGRWEASHTLQLQNLALERLSVRRENICKRFALRTATLSRHQDLLQEDAKVAQNTTKFQLEQALDISQLSLI